MKPALLVAAAFGLLLTSAYARPPFRPDASPVYSTAPEGDLRLHLFFPKGHAAGDRRPAIVFFFGGGWRSGSPEQFYPHCAYFASRGLVAASADYRVSSRHGTTPRECVTDGKAALRWIRSHASKLGVDPCRVAAGGGSAGGHIAAATALLSGFEPPLGDDYEVSSRPDALLLFNPVVDNGPGGASHERVQAYWRDFSPLHNIGRGAPPALLLLGSEDHVLPVATARMFQARMRAVASRCDLRVYPGQPHGFFNYRTGDNPYYYQTLAECDRFLQSLGYLEGNPSPHPRTHRPRKPVWLRRSRKPGAASPASW